MPPRLRFARLSAVNTQPVRFSWSRAAAARLGLVSFLLAASALSACAQSPRIEIVAPGGAARTTVSVEIADRPATREYGLMYRRHLDPDAGMIFVFSTPQHLTFWMKNTIIPLDMIFADSSGKIVGIVRNAEPFSESIDGVDGISQYVLEVNGGFCDRLGVQPGDTLRFIGFVPRAAD
jgi:uncharacterized protein